MVACQVFWFQRALEPAAAKIAVAAPRFGGVLARHHPKRVDHPLTDCVAGAGLQELDFR
ncbi:uncharacterized protein METZ01_LOCUS319003, partial [marine metagenome]